MAGEEDHRASVSADMGAPANVVSVARHLEITKDRQGVVMERIQCAPLSEVCIQCISHLQCALTRGPHAICGAQTAGAGYVGYSTPETCWTTRMTWQE